MDYCEWVRNMQSLSNLLQQQTSPSWEGSYAEPPYMQFVVLLIPTVAAVAVVSARHYVARLERRHKTLNVKKTSLKH